MALIPYPNKDKLDPKAREVVETVPLNIVKMMAGMGALFQPTLALGSAFLNHGVLSPRLRELVVVRMADRLGAEYVLTQHMDVARKFGVSEGELTVLAGELPSKVFNETENAALQLADSLVEKVKAPADQVLKVFDLLGETALHELLLVCGYFHMSTRYAASLEIDIDAGMAHDVVGQMDSLGLNG